MNKILEGILSAGTHARIGVPAEQPAEAITALRKLFEDLQEVQEARLGLMEVRPSSGEPFFTYTVGWLVQGNGEDISPKVIHVLQRAPMGRWPIAIFPLKDEYFTKEAIVFFKREERAKSAARSGWLTKLFRK
jgi:hypothetical protein